MIRAIPSTPAVSNAGQATMMQKRFQRFDLDKDGVLDVHTQAIYMYWLLGIDENILTDCFCSDTQDTPALDWSSLTACVITEPLYGDHSL